MSTIVTRIGKGSELTFEEGDANFTNLNSDKLEKNSGTLTGYKETIHALGSTDAPSILVTNGNVQSVTISSGLALPAFTSATAGQSVTLLVTGTGTATGATGYKFAGGAVDLTNFSVVSVLYDGTIYWTNISTDFQ